MGRASRYSSSESLEQISESEAGDLLPQRLPPQSILTRSPLRVIPYRSQLQTELLSLKEEREDGDELSEREEIEEPVEDGGLEERSDSESDISTLAKRLASSLTEAGGE